MPAPACCTLCEQLWQHAFHTQHTCAHPCSLLPQGQANNWVKNMEVRSNIKVVKLVNPLFLRVLENAIRLGNPVLIEDVGESIDPALEPVLQKQVRWLRRCACW